MVMDALRGYVQLANGLTEVTRQRAQQAARALLQQTGADALTSGLTTKVTDLADEIVATSKSNRQLLQAIVANEVEGAVSRLGFVRQEEVGVLSRRVDKLEKELVETRAAAAAASTTAAAAARPAAAGDPLAPAKSSKAPAVKKAPAKKAAAKKTVAKKTVAKKTVAKKTVAKKTAKKASAKKA
ncbi:phasin family protein [Kribbella italica]|uniref:Polyhydroxyalkanoate synthesis regulator phasin n=1 Tax=Kribbella italica TaxID=1540520 RepID=A0A7W9JAB0_9ACTN|nr:phasin family protein [Kribbella italica]MBB5838062.1 polyhydroxyalkanoate synthesis regulator phasin [Kribbella italica]